MSVDKNKWIIRIVKTDKKKLFKHLAIILLFSTALALGGLVGAYLTVRQGLPDVSELEKFSPSLLTTIYDDAGKVVKEIGTEKRIVITYDKIPEALKLAILATEDPRFFKHKGVDVRGIIRAVRENLFNVFRSRKLQGGSTLTQQLVRNLLLYRQQTLHRKLTEWVLSVQVEKRYSKEKIFEMYCNQFYLGHGAYGVEAAANIFFGKSVKDLALEESALIAGIFRWPSGYSPYNSPKLTLDRRDHVLTRMAAEGFISSAQAEDAKKKPLAVLPLGRDDSDFGATFFEEVRRHLSENYGDVALFRGGLKVYTTLNSEYQQYAEKELVKGLRDHDKRRGWRKDKKNLADDKDFPKSGRKIEDYWLKSWYRPVLEAGDYEDAIVLAVTKTEARVRIKSYAGLIKNDDIERWTGTRQMDKLIRPGDIVKAAVKSVDEPKKAFVASLDQEPLTEGAFLSIEPQTGQIKAMIGGYSFGRTQLNRSTQTARQAGSSIKPLLYTAALDNGFTAASRIRDEPTDFEDKWSHEVWSPKNYDREYKGTVTLRMGLEQSRNVVMANVLQQISPQTGVDYIKKFGISTTLYPYLSLALGTPDIKLIELVSAYTVFPNKGVRIKPYYITRIEDREGNILEETKIESEDVISPQTAFLMVNLMQGVIQRGTASIIAGGLLADKPLAGKTGTTDKYTDAWFIGYSPSLCAGVWVGYDDNKPLGRDETGAVTALPIWTGFFRDIIEAEKKKAKDTNGEVKSEEFEVPSNIEFVAIDRMTGLLAAPICKWRFMEAFLAGAGNIPSRYCTYEDHMLTYNYATEGRVKEER
jgi:penicillin-binding protein 1A